MTKKQKTLAVLGPLSLFLYFTVCLFGLEFNIVDNSIWWKGLIIFVIMGLVPVIMGYKKVSVTLIIIIIYLLLGFISSELGRPLWHPGWVIFLLIPVIDILVKPSYDKDNKNFSFNKGNKSFSFKFHSDNDEDDRE